MDTNTRLGGGEGRKHTTTISFFLATTWTETGNFETKYYGSPP
jgi:hypothetical protein